MPEAIRINAAETRKKVVAGKAMLVCAYEDEAKFARYHLDGAITLADFRSRISALPRDQEIIFY